MTAFHPSGCGQYSERVAQLYFDAGHAGELDGDAVFAGRAEEGGAGARILLTARIRDRRVVALNYRVFGCPHLVAAAEMQCRDYEGGPASALRDFPLDALREQLSIPVEKIGRLLLLEDAFRRLADAAGSAPET